MIGTAVEPPGSATRVLGAQLAAARGAQPAWARLPLRNRLAVVRRFRQRLAEAAVDLAATVELPQRRGVAETLTAEILPLLDACRFLERAAGEVLAPKPLGRRRRPLWLWGSEVELRREPLGVVLVIGPSNYPILLPGVQTLQALVAGNAVVLKPGKGGERAARFVERELAAAGLPSGVLQVLSEEKSAAVAAIDEGVDKVVLTGSASTGRAVLERLARSATPAVMELSGCDPVLVLEDADLDLVAAALRFGLELNASFTCIAPRRVYVPRQLVPALEERLSEELHALPSTPLPSGVEKELSVLLAEALSGGARLVVGGLPQGGSLAPLVIAEPPRESRLLAADMAAPVLSLVPVDTPEEALELAAGCPYRLGAAVFGNESQARALAEHLPAGVVVINDLVVPTADPRVPFGGRGASGFGVTRGAEGLLEMTVTKAMIRRRGRFRPHYDPSQAGDEELFAAFARVVHGAGLIERLRSLADLARLGAARGRVEQQAEDKATRSEK